MKRIIGLSLLVIPTMLSAQSFEILRPSEYSVDRFQEVISVYVDEIPETKRDALAVYRSKLNRAEQSLEILRKRREEAITPKLREDAPKVIHIRAAEARVEHYKKKVRLLELENVKPKRKR